jgi:hypothetical protein
MQTRPTMIKKEILNKINWFEKANNIHFELIYLQIFPKLEKSMKFIFSSLRLSDNWKINNKEAFDTSTIEENIYWKRNNRTQNFEDNISIREENVIFCSVSVLIFSSLIDDIQLDI